MTYVQIDLDNLKNNFGIAILSYGSDQNVEE